MRRYVTGAAIAASLFLLPTATAAADDPPRYEEYYSVFDRGHSPIPYLDKEPYVPQGLAYWPREDEMIVSYYDSRKGGGPARLAILDRETSARRITVTLDDTGHAQALAVSENYLWLASSKRLIRYALSDLAAAHDWDRLPEDSVYATRAYGFVEIAGSKMYLGTYCQDDEENDPDCDKNKNGTAYRYSLSASEDPDYDGHYFAVPPEVQGMAITPEHFVWSRSGGPRNDSEIAVDPRAGAITRRVVAPNMSEDLATVGGQVYVVYESAAAKYPDADYKVRTIHHGPLGELIP